MDTDDPNKETEQLYIHLWHGRDVRDQDMDETGYDGPLLGPFLSVQVEYAYAVRGMLNDNASDGFWLWFDEDPESLCIYYDGKWYGRICILSACNLAKDNYYRKVKRCIPEQAKANHPKKKE